MNTTFLIKREDLVKAFGDPRVVAQFEELQRTVAETSQSTGANVDATTALKDAAFLTLSPNEELPNEFVLQLGEGLAFDIEDGVATLVVQAVIVGGYTVRMLAAGDTELILPVGGVLATRGGTETFSNKTIDAPVLSGLANAADDAAAATAGVPVGGVYHASGALRVRLA